ncbi:hypothetical protein CTE07_22500 [Chitinophaga terrae (ex Kim and Jung 2007)]|nr:hypothetical protein CTE07_22500 [Chitinophaga terrae (ex Kim and Jung 2007)]
MSSALAYSIDEMMLKRLQNFEKKEFKIFCNHLRRRCSNVYKTNNYVQYQATSANLKANVRYCADRGGARQIHQFANQLGGLFK